MLHESAHNDVKRTKRTQVVRRFWDQKRRLERDAVPSRVERIDVSVNKMFAVMQEERGEEQEDEAGGNDDVILETPTEMAARTKREGRYALLRHPTARTWNGSA